ncbi:MAG: glycoside hydrolase family 97 protein, partial [Chitinophagaceae bacterium]
YKTGWVYPALYQTEDTYTLVTEAGLDGTYCATRLLSSPSKPGNFKVGFPDPREIFPGKALVPQINFPFASPWRVITLGDLKTVVESTAGTDLAQPSVLKDISYVKPGNSSWSWINSKDDFIIYKEQKKYIDFASDMNWEYCLIDVNWDKNIGYEKMKELADYAKTKNVGLLLWYNSAGDWNTVKYTPKNLLTTQESRVKEFARLQEMGIKGVKIDFFGGDGQSVIQYYIDMLNDAAKAGLMVNFHGATLPRGWARTYPNLLTVEAVRGYENVTFTQKDADKEAEFCTVLPYARNVFDPMDYTPMNLYKNPSNVQRKTSGAFQLALSVLFTSGLQHFAESPEGMAKVPANVQAYVKTIPTKWDDIKFIDGVPGEFAVIARKAGKKWYVGGITNKSAQKIDLNLAQFGGKKATLFLDGKEKYTWDVKDVPVKDKLNFQIEPSSGFVLVVE